MILKHTPLTTHTIIVSDIHLGSSLSRAKELTELLKENSFKRLILLGDIFDDLNLKRLTPDHWHFLSYVRELSQNDRGVEVVWARGNHDAAVENVLTHFSGVPVYKEYSWEMNNKKYIATHGDDFDLFLFNENIFGSFIRAFYRFIEYLDQGKKTLTRFIGRMHTLWLRISPRVARGAAKYAKENGYDYIFCGHTHEAIHEIFFKESAQPVHYFNTGCCIRLPSTYVAIDDEGSVSIRTF